MKWQMERNATLKKLFNENIKTLHLIDLKCYRASIEQLKK